MTNLPEEIIKKGRELGLNISKVCGNALSDMIQRREGHDCPKKGDGSSVNASSKEELVVPWEKFRHEFTGKNLL